MQRLVGKPEQEQRAELERISQAAWTDRGLMAFREVLDWFEKHGDVPRHKKDAAQDSLWFRWRQHARSKKLTPAAEHLKRQIRKLEERRRREQQSDAAVALGEQ